MKIRYTTSRLALCGALSGALFVGCDKSGEAPAPPGAPGAEATGTKAGGAAVASATSPMLAHVPADSPYVFAATTPMPKEVVEGLFRAMAPIIKKAEAELKAEMGEAGETDSTDEKIARAVVGELIGNLNPEGMAKLGISLTPRFVLYGLGVLPVMRLELADPKALLAAIERVETKAGQKAPRTKLGEQEYFSFGDADGQVILAVVGNELIFSITPTKLAAKTLPLILGQEKPAKSLGDAGTLDAIAKAHGLMGYGIGYVDATILTDIIIGKSTGLNAEIWAALDADVGELSAVCVTEIQGLVSNTPRMVAGYTEVTGKRWSVDYVLETRPELAKELMGLTSPVPGLGGETSGLLNFGFGINVGNVLTFAENKAKAIQSAPYKCEHLAWANEGATMAAMQLPSAKQQIPPFAQGLKGVKVSVSDVKITNGEPSNIKARAVIAMDNPDQALAMLKGIAPELASLTINPDGKATPLPAGMVPPMFEAPHAAMTKSGVAISIGAGEEKGLADALGAPAGANAPMLVFGYDFKRFMELSMGSMGVSAEEKEMFDAFGGMFGYLNQSMHFGDKGVVFRQVINLN